MFHVKMYSKYMKGVKSKRFKEHPKFNQVAGTLPLLNFDPSILQDILEKIDRSYGLPEMVAISNRAEHWIRNFQPEKLIAVNQEKNTEFYNTLDEKQKKWLVEVCKTLRSNKDYSNLMEQLYPICHHESIRRSAYTVINTCGRRQKIHHIIRFLKYSEKQRKYSIE